MNRLIRYWNQNRRKIIIIALVVVFMFLFIKILNEIAKTQGREEKENNIINTENLPIKSIITGERVDAEQTVTNVNLIESFIQKCNQKDIEGAYNMLSDNCKSVLYSNNVENFKTDYYDIIFSVERTADIKNYKNSSTQNTYQVVYYEDSLATGNVSNTDVCKDYITTSKKDNRINVNSFIDSQEIDKTVEENGIEIQVIRKKVFIDSEKYDLKITNKNNKTILMNTGKKEQGVYIMDTDNIRYVASSNSIKNSTCMFLPYNIKNIEITYIRNYEGNKTTKRMVFADIVLDNEAYENGEKVEKYKMAINI